MTAKMVLMGLILLFFFFYYSYYSYCSPGLEVETGLRRAGGAIMSAGEAISSSAVWRIEPP